MGNIIPTHEEYYAHLAAIHSALAPTTYLEVGVQSGASFQLASDATLAIGIDPEPAIQYPQPPGGHIYPMTSDDFFASGTADRLLGSRSIDFAFIDGMHLFEYVLRDFVNIERYSSGSTLVVFHDVLPLDSTTAARERTTDVWTGDVWKIVPCLLRHRPELTMSIVDAGPSGLCLVSGLDPENTTLRRADHPIVEEFLAWGFEEYESRRDQVTELTFDLDGALARHGLL